MRPVLPCLMSLLLTSPALAADGLIDTAFGVFSSGRNIVAHDLGGSQSDTLADVLVAADGKVFLIGTAKGTGDVSRLAITRLTSAGIRDDAFGDAGTVFSPASMIANARRARFDTNGNILIAGSRTFGTTDTDFLLCRYSQQGAPVVFAATGGPCVSVAFDVSGGNVADVANDLLVDPSGRIVLAGSAGLSATHELAAVARLLADGTPDAAFGSEGKRTHHFVSGKLNRFNAIARRADGKYLAVGEAGDPAASNGTDALFARLTTSGDSDPSFQGGSGFTSYTVNDGNAFNRDDVARSIRILSDGSALMVGTAQTGSDPSRHLSFIYKIDPLDVANVNPSFGNQGRILFTGIHSMEVNDVLVQSDGKIVMTSTARSSASTADLHVMRLKPNGNVDSGTFGVSGRTEIDFVTPGERDIGIRAALQNGRLIVAGHSLRVAPSNYDISVARLSSDLIFAHGQE